MRLELSLSLNGDTTQRRSNAGDEFLAKFVLEEVQP